MYFTEGTNNELASLLKGSTASKRKSLLQQCVFTYAKDEAETKQYNGKRTHSVEILAVLRAYPRASYTDLAILVYGDGAVENRIKVGGLLDKLIRDKLVTKVSKGLFEATQNVGPIERLRRLPEKERERFLHTYWKALLGAGLKSKVFGDGRALNTFEAALSRHATSLKSVFFGAFGCDIARRSNFATPTMEEIEGALRKFYSEHQRSPALKGDPLWTHYNNWLRKGGTSVAAVCVQLGLKPTVTRRTMSSVEADISAFYQRTGTRPPCTEEPFKGHVDWLRRNGDSWEAVCSRLSVPGRFVLGRTKEDVAKTIRAFYEKHGRRPTVRDLHREDVWLKNNGFLGVSALCGELGLAKIRTGPKEGLGHKYALPNDKVLAVRSLLKVEHSIIAVSRVTGVSRPIVMQILNGSHWSAKLSDEELAVGAATTRKV